MSSFDPGDSAFKPAHLVTLSPIPSSSVNPRRLSSRFSKPSSPVRAPANKLAWVSLQGRLVGAEEATTARAIGGGLSREEAVSWELFSPIHRVLIVAVVAAAAAKCQKNRQIIQLRNCVQLRDEILISMQQKLDDLCEQMNTIKDQPQAVAEFSAYKVLDFSSRRSSLSHKSDSVCTDCWFCDQRRVDLGDLLGNTLAKTASGDDMFGNRLSTSKEAEQEERRMSDLSDWASSVTSAAELQLNSLAEEQDIYNIKRECEEKDAAIKELSAFIRSKDVATSKRIVELEEVIRRKNTSITKLKKDLVVLEQKVVQLTRARRRSSTGASTEKKQLPLLTDNLLYDMDSSTSPSSDSDCSSRKQTPSIVEAVEAPLSTPVHSSHSCDNIPSRTQKSAQTKVSSSSRKLSLQVPSSGPMSPLMERSLNQRRHSADSSKQTPSIVEAVEAPLSTPVQSSHSCENVPNRNQKSAQAKISSSSRKLSLPVPSSRPMSPLMERSLNQRHHSADSSMLKQASAAASLKSNRRRAQSGSKDAGSQKRWM